MSLYADIILPKEKINFQKFHSIWLKSHDWKIHFLHIIIIKVLSLVEISPLLTYWTEKCRWITIIEKFNMTQISWLKTTFLHIITFKVLSLVEIPPLLTYWTERSRWIRIIQKLYFHMNSFNMTQISWLKKTFFTYNYNQSFVFSRNFTIAYLLNWKEQMNYNYTKIKYDSNLVIEDNIFYI